MAGMARLALVALMGLGLAGCAARAETRAVPMPALVVPPVPARVLVPEIEEVAPPVVEVAVPAKPATKPAAATTPAEKPEPEPEQPVAPPARTEEATRVRTPQTANDTEAERQVRAVMARAQSTLDNVDYTALSQAARQQYDTAKRFIRQANSALAIRNYVFARNLADKADTLARQLK